MLYSLKVHSKTNAGDKHCNPLDYFDFGEYRPIDIRDATNYRHIGKGDVVVIGGGGLINHCDTWNKRINEIVLSGATIVVWAAGENTHCDDTTKKEPIGFFTKMTWVRDYGHPMYPYLPCVSCMHPEFDYPYAIDSYGVGVVRHINRPLPKHLADYPSITNDKPIGDIITFIRGKKTIYANTYHGAYWSLLLDKPTTIFDVFSTRFLGLPHVNLYANQPSSYTPVKGQFLDECRQLNRRAYDDVKTLLDQRLIDVL